jgi:hypothetical protein
MLRVLVCRRDQTFADGFGLAGGGSYNASISIRKIEYVPRAGGYTIIPMY